MKGYGKTELLNDLGTICEVVLSIGLVEEFQGVRRYIASVFEIDGKAAIKRNYSFYVTGEGTELEEAFWAGAIPPALGLGTSSFSTALDESIGQLVAQGTILGAAVELMHDSYGFAVIVVWREDAGLIVEERKFVEFREGVVVMRTELIGG